MEELFLTKGYCTKEDLEKVAVVQQEYLGRTGSMLLNWGIITEEQLLNVYSEYFEILLFDKKKYSVGEKVLTTITNEFWIKHHLFPIKKDNNILYVISDSPYNTKVFSFLEQELGLEIELFLAESSTLDEFQVLYEVIDDALGLEYDDEIDKLKELASEAPIIQKVNAIFTKAVNMRVSDIHYESFKNGMHIRFRVDGKLQLIERISALQKASIIARLKLLSSMNIAENRLPQDGRISIKVAGKSIDIRASSIPTGDGESFVLRLLGKQAVTYSLGYLDFFDDHIELLRKIVKTPHGIFLTTGPTGSGKTTTLYSILNELNNEDTKVITVEDPVEYELDGISQIQVKSEIDFTFANALRSILRQDPDVIMIGEIRDEETARIAIQSALTGHLVLSTLHTNSALGAVSRLLDIGMEMFLLNSSINAVMAQRLVRKLCPACKVKSELSAEAREGLKIDQLLERYPMEKISPFEAKGCEECNFTGYKGRLPVAEIIPFDNKLKVEFEKNENFTDIGKLGYRSLQEDATLKYLSGLTSLQELSTL
ncbi:MAG: Type IV fimbrial assembly, ATPase PilB [uncultured Sulfurovum sp.]|uniref:Type IV fimbrial assembly, ATPase PilB n=1 Tax=uncultured Sulfurovum sp. TaxID=269237 RepID=A0A6S6T985_9BACT|nr:MAG: Type IV fimbrial assembly, ATPase PilB [uncultured Sulfurovum sp.]